MWSRVVWYSTNQESSLSIKNNGDMKCTVVWRNFNCWPVLRCCILRCLFNHQHTLKWLNVQPYIFQRVLVVTEPLSGRLKFQWEAKDPKTWMLSQCKLPHFPDLFLKQRQYELRWFVMLNKSIWLVTWVRRHVKHNEQIFPRSKTHK